ncbi:MAG TPA: class I SAM-dependent methyltransferase [Gammaproteobacteria bacterium]|nr:class I SAM-dependent methyltransferase [Gammaproteobacteria bacterium]
MAALARLVVKQGREKSLRRRHPWVFSGAVARVEGRAAAGETVDVVDTSGAFLARAAFSPSSQIRARVWTFDRDETVDAKFFARRLERGIATRRRLGLLAPDGACRLVFSESDGLPGLVVDRYADHLVCQFLSAGAEAWRETIVAELGRLLAPAGIYERSEGGARHKEGLASRRGSLGGEEPPPRLEYRSGALRRVVDIAQGQKTGAYLDQQWNRERVAHYAPGARVLDAFAYTGGFALACLAAGAEQATLVESSAEALRHAVEEAERNGRAGECRMVHADVFEELRALRARGERFGLVVLDPPKFVHSAEQVRSGSRGYKDINLLAFELLEPGGILATFSCSGHVDAALFQKIVAGAAVDAGRSARILERLGQPPDHPVALEFPEGEYLKGLIVEAD